MKCKICKNTFKTNTELCTYYKNPLKCRCCSYFNMTLHQEQHFGENHEVNFSQCSCCAKVFTSIHQLYRHADDRHLVSALHLPMQALTGSQVHSRPSSVKKCSVSASSLTLKVDKELQVLLVKFRLTYLGIEVVEELLLLDQGLLDPGRNPLLPVAPHLGADAQTLTVGQALVSNHLEKEL